MSLLEFMSGWFLVNSIIFFVWVAVFYDDAAY